MSFTPHHPGPLRGALIGCGYIAPRHLLAWQGVAEGELVALCDLDGDRAAKLASEWGSPAVRTSIDELIEREGEQLDFLDISLPPELHEEVVRRALDAGLHVLCQKPIADTQAAARRIAALAAGSPQTVAINEIWRWIPAYKKAGELIAEGVVGEVEAVRFSGSCNLLLPRLGDETPSATYERFSEMPRLVLLEYGIHVVDMLCEWLGHPGRLRAEVSRIQPSFAGDDGAAVELRFGALAATVQLDFCLPGPATLDNLTGESLAVRGAAGLLTVSGARELRWHPNEGESVVHVFEQDQRDAAFEECHRDFARAVLDSRPPVSTTERALRSLEIVESCYESAAQGGDWVAVRPASSTPT